MGFVEKTGWFFIVVYGVSFSVIGSCVIYYQVKAVVHSIWTKIRRFLCRG